METAFNKAAIRRLMADGEVRNTAEIANATGLSPGVVRRNLSRLQISKEIERVDGPGHPQYRKGPKA